MMKTLTWFPLMTLLVPCTFAADEVSTIKAYVDSDICARLMLGPITDSRMQCSKSTFKDGATPVAVRLRNNMVFTVNKDKMLKPLVGQLADLTGKLNVKNGTMKIDSAMATTADSIPQGDPARMLVDARMYKATGANAKLHERVRHELALMPYLSEFDFISFNLAGSTVILTGWTVRQTNRSTAEGVVKNLEGVEAVVNNIDVLPLGSFDMQIRAGVRAALQRQLSRYFWGNGSDIKIVVKNGNVILLGTVATKADSDLAFIQSNGISGVFKVFNLLQVRGTEKGA